MTALNNTWRKSSKSGSNGACVEVRFTGESIEVRDTKNRSGGQLSFTVEEWHAFISGVKHLEFDRPA
jgi:predicted secreted Zn-dependent protease